MEAVIYPGLVLRWHGHDLYHTITDPGRARLGHPPWPSPTSTSLADSAPQEAGIAEAQETATLTLIEQLGSRANGPVWLCEGPASKRLVLKLFAEEFYVDDVRSTFFEDCVQAAVTVDDMWHWNSTPEAKMFREAMTYRHLKSLQGTILPLSYGFYEFHVKRPKFPLSPMVGHVTEFIENGSSPIELARLWKDQGEAGILKIMCLLKAVLATYAEIHQHRVTHQDIASRNMRVIWPDSEEAGPPRIVIFDFDRAQFGQNHMTQINEIASLDDFLNEMGLVYALIPEVENWIRTTGKPLFDALESGLAPPGGWPQPDQDNSSSETPVNMGSNDESDVEYAYWVAEAPKSPEREFPGWS